MKLSTFATPAHLSAARDYLGASAFLLSTPEARQPASRFSDPASFLIAHGAELTLKAYLSFCGKCDCEVEYLGHNLSRAYEEVRRLDPLLGRAVHKAVGAKWRVYLKEARNAQVADLIEFGITSENGLASLGIPSNADIGNQLPTFGRDLQWLSDRHINKGGKFRYLQFGIDSVPFIQAFGLRECTVPKTVRWGCKYILNALEKKRRQ